MHGTEEKMKNFNMMKKLLALTLGAAMLLAVMTGCGKKDTAQEPADDQQQQQEEQQPAEPATLLEQIKAKGKVVVGTEAQYAPYEFKDLDANFAGCDMWLAHHIANSSSSVTTAFLRKALSIRSSSPHSPCFSARSSARSCPVCA